jgi:hypothetical protein
MLDEMREWDIKLGESAPGIGAYYDSRDGKVAVTRATTEELVETMLIHESVHWAMNAFLEPRTVFKIRLNWFANRFEGNCGPNDYQLFSLEERTAYWLTPPCGKDSDFLVFLSSMPPMKIRLKKLVHF